MASRRLLGFAFLLLPFAAAAAEPIRVTGRILGGERRIGLAGAQVELFAAYETYAVSVRRLTDKAEPAPLAKARSNAEGSFELLAPESGCFRVVVQAEGHLSEEIALVPLLEDTVLPTTALLKESFVEVRTVGPDGRPLPGIELRTIESEPWDRRFVDFAATGWQLRSTRRFSDESGRALLAWGLAYERPTVAAVSLRFLGQTGTAATPMDAITLRLSPSRTVTIEARGAGGKPVPGALVRWKGWPVGMTGPDGRLEIASPPQREVILESHEGWTRFVPSGETGIVPVRLEPRRRIAGRVVDPQNRPVAGAVIWSGWPLASPAVRSDAAGTFLIEIPAGEESWLQAGAAGFVPSERRLIQQAAAEQVTLTLAPAATLSGIVVDRAGRPVAGTQIVLYRTLGRQGASIRVLSGADGRFRFTGLQPGGTFRLAATRTGFARTEVTARTAVAGQSSPPTRIVMEDGLTAFGRVVDDGGRPISGAEVKLVTLMHAPLDAQTDETGRFEFRHLSPGRIYVLASHPGYASGSLGEIELPAKAPVVDLGTLRLPPGEAIEGRVTDSRGMPIEGAQVSAFQERQAPWMPGPAPSNFREPARTGPDGSFRLEGLEGGGRFQVSVRHAQYVEVSLPGVLAPTEEPLRIEMKPARALSGQVVDSEGEPVANASLVWVQEIRIGGGTSGTSRELGRTDAEGKFRVSGLPQGSMDLEVTAEGFAGRRIAGIQIPADKDLEDLRITLQRAILLNVRVLNGKGEPVPDVWVHADAVEQKNTEIPVFPGRFMRGSDRTDFAGRCRVTLPAPGTYRVAASREGAQAEAQVTVGAAGTSVELRFPPGSEVSGWVTDEDGAAISGATVHLQQTDPGRPRAGATLTDGTFTFSDVPDGDYRLRAEQAGLTSEILDVTVGGRPIHGLELRLDRPAPGAVLTGRIVGLSSEDLSRLRVRAFGQGEMVAPVRPDREGTYRFEKLSPGDWHISANLPDGRSRSGLVKIARGDAAAELDLEFSPGLSLSGQVFLDGAPLSGAEVRAWSREVIASADTAYDGTFTLRDLAAGETTLVVAGPQGLGGVRSLRMTDNQEISIELATGRLTGRVSSATGEPVEEAAVRVEAWVPALKISFSGPVARTGAEGVFEIPRIVSGTYKLTILKEGFAPAELTAEVLAGEERTVEIRLTPQAP